MQDNHHYSEFGGTFSILSIISAIFTWISTKEMIALVTLCSGCVALISGVLGSVYLYYGIKERRKNLRK